MKKLILLSVFLVSCAGIPQSPILGTLYTSVKWGGVATQKAGFSKMGEATCRSFFFVALGDCSITKAAQKGGISQIHHVDYETFNFFGIYSSFTVKVYGD